MSSNNYINNLLNGEVVKWLPVGEALVRTKGTKITAGKMKEIHKDGAPLKIFAGGKTIAFVNYEDIPEKDINREPSIIVKSRGIIEFEFYDKPFSHKSEMWSYHSNNEEIEIKFVYYFLKLNEPYFQNIGSKMQMPQISTPVTEKFEIPIPPLNVQREIIRVLDLFTDLIQALKLELGLRSRQNEYCRTKLFNSMENRVEWKTLKDIAKIKNGKDWKHLGEGDIPVYGSGGVMRYVDSYSYNQPTVLIPRKGTITNIFYVDKPFWNVDTIYYTEIDLEQIRPKFFYYFMKTVDLEKLDVGAGRPSLTQAILNEIEVPVPSIDEQENIIQILDKFEILTDLNSDGLPHEIDLRQKQYEYYRSLLLGFNQTNIEKGVLSE